MVKNHNIITKYGELNKILELLIENPSFSIRKISQEKKINYKSAYKAVMALNSLNLIKSERIGNTIKCEFNKNFHPLVFEAECKRRDILIQNSRESF